VLACWSRKPPSDGSSSRFLSSPRALLGAAELLLGALESLMFSRASGVKIDVTCLRAGRDSLRASHDARRRKCATRFGCHICTIRLCNCDDLPVVLFVYPDVRLQAPKASTPEDWGVGDHEFALPSRQWRDSDCARGFDLKCSSSRLEQTPRKEVIHPHLPMV